MCWFGLELFEGCEIGMNYRKMCNVKKKKRFVRGRERIIIIIRFKFEMIFKIYLKRNYGGS